LPLFLFSLFLSFSVSQLQGPSTATYNLNQNQNGECVSVETYKCFTCTTGNETHSYYIFLSVPPYRFVAGKYKDTECKEYLGTAVLYDNMDCTTNSGSCWMFWSFASISYLQLELTAEAPINVTFSQGEEGEL